LRDAAGQAFWLAKPFVHLHPNELGIENSPIPERDDLLSCAANMQLLAIGNSCGNFPGNPL
jgi:hypothetical protein